MAVVKTSDGNYSSSLRTLRLEVLHAADWTPALGDLD
jgi:hypothetical protein